MATGFLAFSVAVVLATGIGVYLAGDAAQEPNYAAVRGAYRTSERQLLERYGEVIH